MIKTYLVQTTLPGVVRIRAEEFQFHSRDSVLYFCVEGRRVAAFPMEAVIGVAEKPFGFGNIDENGWIENEENG